MAIAFKTCYEELNAKEHHPTLHVLVNECSCVVKEYIASKRANLQFNESYNQREDAAKDGCKTIKYHIIATLCTIN